MVKTNVRGYKEQEEELRQLRALDSALGLVMGGRQQSKRSDSGCRYSAVC